MLASPKLIPSSQTQPGQPPRYDLVGSCCRRAGSRAADTVCLQKPKTIRNNGPPDSVTVEQAPVKAGQLLPEPLELPSQLGHPLLQVPAVEVAALVTAGAKHASMNTTSENLRCLLKITVNNISHCLMGFPMPTTYLRARDTVLAVRKAERSAERVAVLDWFLLREEGQRGQEADRGLLGL